MNFATTTQPELFGKTATWRNGILIFKLVLALLGLVQQTFGQNFAVTLSGANKWGGYIDSRSQLVYDQSRGLILALDNTFDRVILGPRVFGYYPDEWRPMPRLDNEYLPPISTGSAWIYDSKRQKCLLLTGDLEQSNAPSSSGLYSYGVEGWRRVDAAGVIPPPAIRAIGAFDNRRGRAIFLLRSAGDPAKQWQTWEWTGSVWEQGPTLSDASPDSFTYASRHGIGFLSGEKAIPDGTGRLQEAVWFYHPGETATQSSWESIVLGGNPYISTEGGNLAYDHERDIVFRCGGKSSSSPYAYKRQNSVWSWDKLAWVELIDGESEFDVYWPLPGNYPFPKGRAAMGVAFDTDRDVLVMHGGISVYITCDPESLDTLGVTIPSIDPDVICWAATHYWRDTLEQKSDDAPSTNCLRWVRREDVGSPGQRVHHAMAYDPDRGVTVFFGGEIGKDPSETYFNDTWEYDGRTWRNIIIDGPKPPARSFHSMAYDPLRKRILLFGGFNGNVSALGDTWEYSGDGRRGVWLKVGDLAVNQGRAGACLAFDPAYGRIVRQGGINVPFEGGIGTRLPPFDDVSLWVDDRWLPLSGSGPAVWAGGMVYDPVRRGMVLLGGYKGAQIPPHRSGDTWLFQDRSWIQQRIQTTGPSARAEVASAFDAGRGRTVFVGGDNGEAGTGEQVWEYSSTGRWRQVTPLPPGSGRAGAAMVYDAKRGVLVLMGGAGAGAPNGNDGGRYADTWESQPLVDVPVITDLSPNGDIFRCPGESVDFRVTINSDPELQLQWYKDSKPIDGATDPILKLERVGAEDSGTYSVVASSGCGDTSSAISFPARLHVGIRIDQQSSHQTNVVCGSVEHFVEAKGNGSLRYQWYLNGKPVSDRDGVSGSTNNRVRIQPLLYRHEGRWEVVITDDCGPEHSVTNEPAILTLTPGPQWVLRTTNGPSARTAAAMVYDSQRGVTVLFGGLGYAAEYPGQRVYLNDLWEWNGVRWTQRLPFSTNGWGIAPNRHTLPNYTHTPDSELLTSHGEIRSLTEWK